MQTEPEIGPNNGNQGETKAPEPKTEPAEGPAGWSNASNPASPPKTASEAPAEASIAPPAPVAVAPGTGPPRPVLTGPGPQPRPPFPLVAAPPRPQGLPLGLPPGLAPALRGASPAQIAEMIAAARQIQQQRLMQHQIQQQQAGNAAAGAAAALAGGAPAPGAANGAPPVPQTQQPAPPRPALILARPAGAGSGMGPPLPGHAPAFGQAIPLKRKADEPLAIPGSNPALGYLPQTGPGMQLPHQPPLGAPHHAGHALPSTSEEVATSAGEAIPALPAGSLSAHYMYGNSGEMYEDDDGSGESGQGDGKKARLVWTQELHNRFINALSHLGLKHAVPKNILSMMNVEGMTRENVASHLQKYRLYLKKIGGHSEKDRIDADVLQSLHEQNVQHMAAQQAMQHSMAAVTESGFMGGFNHGGYHHPFTAAAAAGGAPVAQGYAHGTAAYPGNVTATGTVAGTTVGGDHLHMDSTGAVVASAYVPPGPDDIVEGIPVSDVPVDIVPPGCTVPTCEPVSPTVTAAVATGGRFNPQGWQYPPLPIPDHVGPQLVGPSGFYHMHGDAAAVMGMPPGQGHGGPNAGPACDIVMGHVGQHHSHSHHNLHDSHHHGHHGMEGAHQHQHQHAMGAALGGNGGGVAMGIVAMDDAHIHHHAVPAVWHDHDGVAGTGEGWVEGWPQHAEHDDEDDHDGNNGGDGMHGHGHGQDAAVHAVEDEDGDDPPLIPAVPSAGDLHHAVVERLPMQMADTA